MKTVEIKGTLREANGTKGANKLRKEGKVPAVLYGGEENIHFSVDRIPFEKIINTPEVYFIEIDIDGKKYKSILKDVQYHPVNDAPMHADFMQIFDDKKAIVKLPVELTGISTGVVKGGKLRLVSRRLTVKGLPADLPESITVDITNVDLGQSVKVKDIDVKGVEVLDAPNAVIVQVKMSRAAMANKAAAEAEA